ncbi:YbaB/EbfC family nucleoid-associated protein [Nocardia sp. NPDC051990]|uniref:YbaB/EbfC family nucleoid-associated protein n=1 Tax=Nocardia sp. NPDC051990 TaxID=3155285 RepID=UPI003445BBAB
MDSYEQAQLSARTNVLQGEVDTMLATYEQQLRDIANARDVLATATAEGWSSDNLIRVTANSAGVPVDVWVDPATYKRITPDKLGASITEAAQAAARAAKAEIDAVLAPVTAAAAEFVPPEDIFTSIPFVGRPIGDILPPPPGPEQVPTGPEPDADEDEGPHWKGWGQSKNGW